MIWPAISGIKTLLKSDGTRQARLPAIGVIVLILAWSALPTDAQYQLPQDGRLFDANPQVGGNRYNYTRRPISPLMSGNLSATGNIRGGLSLRSFSPISSPLSFRAPLGSGALSGFRRDSVSVADSDSPLGRFIGRPYYDPASTVPSTGYLSGQYALDWGLVSAPPPAAPGSTYLGETMAQPLDLRLQSRLDLRSRIIGAPPSPTRPEASTIFGVGELPAASEAVADGQYLPPPWFWQAELGPESLDPLSSSARQADLASSLDTRLDFRLDQQMGPKPLGSSLNMILEGDATALLLEGQAGLQQEQTELLPTPDALQPVAGLPQPGQTQETPQQAQDATLPTLGTLDPSLLPGNDVFTDMQLALTLQRNPAAEWFTEIQAAVRHSATAVPELQKFADAQAEEFIGQVMSEPIRTFVGRADSSLNDELLKAEALLDIGQYYEAAARYDAARVLDPLNPLPLIGKGHAMLAAGQYLSAAVLLTRGLERFPELARFNVDLDSLMGGGEIIDIRRADIMRLLDQREDPRLRFLLGYLEYHTGDHDRGLENLEKAAAQAEPGSIMRRYPAMLRGGVLPVPKVPISVPTGPEAVPAEPGAAPSAAGQPPEEP
jgi:tetratricopeptide (TPR) repeat protein